MSYEQRRKTLRSYISSEEPRTKDTMEDFLKQMLPIEQNQVDREDKPLEKEAIKQNEAQMEEQRETDKRMMAELHDWFMQLLQEVQIPHERNSPPTPLPCLHIQKICEETDDMTAYLNTFEATAMVSEWSIELWSIHLRGSLSGAGLMAVSALTAVQQTDFQIVKQTLLSVYQISSETRRKMCSSKHSMLASQISGYETSNRIFIRV